MSLAVPKSNLFTACIDAITEAEKIFTQWTPEGYSMRVAPESFVQMQIAKKLYESNKKMESR